jgi:hypothetical protein
MVLDIPVLEQCMHINILYNVVHVVIYVRAYMLVMVNIMYYYTFMYYVQLSFKVLKHY